MSNALREDGKTWAHTTYIGEGLYAVARDGADNVVVLAVIAGRVYESIATLGVSDAGYRAAVDIATKVDRMELPETEAAIVDAYNAWNEARFAA